ncbi:hypothetical protein ACVIJ6_000621 [Bradyrhizobium sp. USDA 4369]
MRFADSAAISFDFEDVRSILFTSILVRNWCGGKTRKLVAEIEQASAEILAYSQAPELSTRFASWARC